MKQTDPIREWYRKRQGDRPAMGSLTELKREADSLLLAAEGAQLKYRLCQEWDHGLGVARSEHAVDVAKEDGDE